MSRGSFARSGIPQMITELLKLTLLIGLISVATTRRLSSRKALEYRNVMKLCDQIPREIMIGAVSNVFK
jgi:uncharacterized membrane protein